MLNTKKYLLLLVVATLSSVFEIFAAGTPAGTVIQSRSRVTFTTASGAKIDTAYSAFVTITVAQKGAFNITPATNSFVTASDSTNADYSVAVTNSGNGNDIGKLSAVSSKGWIAQIYFDSNGDGILQPSEITAGSISQTTSISADAQYKIVVRVKVPRGESLNGVKDSTTLLVKSNFDSTKTNSGLYITTVQTPGLVGIASGLAVDNPNPSVGQNVTFTFTLTNNGSVAAQAMTISNLFPNGFTFVSASTNLGTINSSANPVLWTIGNVSTGATVNVSITLLVNSNVSPSTILNNQFYVNYSVGSNNYSVGSNSASITIGGTLSYAVEISALFNSLIREASDTAWYRFKVKNIGAFKDVIELNYASSRNLDWKLYRDGNNNGIWDFNDPILTNTNGKAGVDVDSVATGDSVRVFAMAPVPRFENDNLKDSMQIIVRSSGDSSKTANVWGVTTMLVPVVTLNKSVFPVGDQPAGSIITYTITYSNNGSSAVNNFSVSDIAPAFTNYLSNSVKVNSISVNDNTGNVIISENSNNQKVITVNIGTLAAKSNGSVEFKVKIK